MKRRDFLSLAALSPILSILKILPATPVDHTEGYIMMLNGNGAGQVPRVTHYNKLATNVQVDKPWQIAPKAGDEFIIVRSNHHSTVYPYWNLKRRKNEV